MARVNVIFHKIRHFMESQLKTEQTKTRELQQAHQKMVALEDLTTKIFSDLEENMAVIRRGSPSSCGLFEAPAPSAFPEDFLELMAEQNAKVLDQIKTITTDLDLVATRSRNEVAGTEARMWYIIDDMLTLLESWM